VEEGDVWKCHDCSGAQEDTASMPESGGDQSRKKKSAARRRTVPDQDDDSEEEEEDENGDLPGIPSDESDDWDSCCGGCGRKGKQFKFLLLVSSRVLCCGGYLFLLLPLFDLCRLARFGYLKSFLILAMFFNKGSSWRFPHI
jgi:hypothetical protein